jgi:hypothetical protein
MKVPIDLAAHPECLFGELMDEEDNDDGVIAGSGYFDGLHRGFLLIPNEP